MTDTSVRGYWLKGPSGKLVKCSCESEGVHVPIVAAALRVKPHSMTVNGFYLSLDREVLLWESLELVRNGRGDTDTNPILVDGDQVEGGSATSEASNETKEQLAGIAMRMHTSESTFDSSMNQGAGLHESHDGYWMEGPCGKLVKVRCEPEGIYIPDVAEALQLKPELITLNGACMCTSNGFVSLEAVELVRNGRGGNYATPILVGGDPEEGGSATSEASNETEEQLAATAMRMRACEGIWLSSMIQNQRAGPHVSHDSSGVEANTYSTGLRHRKVRLAR